MSGERGADGRAARGAEYMVTDGRSVRGDAREVTT
jgi:hypothetical protein